MRFNAIFVKQASLYAVLISTLYIGNRRVTNDNYLFFWWIAEFVKAKIKKMASAEYNAGGSDEARKVIDAMADVEELLGWLKKLVENDMDLGVKIIGNAGR